MVGGLGIVCWGYGLIGTACRFWAMEALLSTKTNTSASAMMVFILRVIVQTPHLDPDSGPSHYPPEEVRDIVPARYRTLASGSPLHPPEGPEPKCSLRLQTRPSRSDEVEKRYRGLMPRLILAAQPVLLHVPKFEGFQKHRPANARQGEHPEGAHALVGSPFTRRTVRARSLQSVAEEPRFRKKDKAGIVPAKSLNIIGD